MALGDQLGRRHGHEHGGLGVAQRGLQRLDADTLGVGAHEAAISIGFCGLVREWLPVRRLGKR